MSPALLSPLERERVLKDTGGDRVIIGGVTTWGRVENWPDTEDLGSEFVDQVLAENSVVIAAGIVPEVCIDPVEGVSGIGEPITVGSHDWVVRGITKASPNGSKLRLWLGE